MADFPSIGGYSGIRSGGYSTNELKARREEQEKIKYFDPHNPNAYIGYMNAFAAPKSKEVGNIGTVAYMNAFNQGSPDDKLGKNLYFNA